MIRLHGPPGTSRTLCTTPTWSRIAGNARALVEKEFTCEKAVEGYREILNDQL
jgi:hypothetical protein